MEETDIRANFVFSSGGEVNYNYQVGVLEAEDASYQVAIVAVAEVDQRILVAVPEQAWHRKKQKRLLPSGALQKVVSVMVPGCLDDNREVPEDQPSFKIWLGLLAREFEELTDFGREASVSTRFPVREDGLDNLPYAQSLVEIAKDHFTFLTAESGGGIQTEANVDQRLGLLEEGLKAIQASLERMQPSVAAAPRPSALKSTPKAVPKKPQTPAMDPQVARQALAAGVSPAALDEMAAVLGLPPGLPQPSATPRVKINDPVESEEEEEMEEILDGKVGGSGSADPMQKAVLQLSHIITKMSQDKKRQTDKNIESILDRAESGSVVGGESSSGRSKAAALRRLRNTLVQRPELIYQALEARMAEDWGLQGNVPGGARGAVSARGWAEHRSRVQAFPSSIRSMWALCGVWDALRDNNVSLARARVALSVAQLDQQAVDRGSWLVAGEISLEDPPPYSSFSTHRGVEPWESSRREVARANPLEAQGHSRLPGEEAEAILELEEGRRSCGARAQAQTKTWQGFQRRREGCSQVGGTAPSELTRCESGNVKPSQHPTAVTNPGEVPARKPPGADAPKSSVARMWSSLARWVLRGQNGLAQFLRSVLGNSSPQRPVTAPTVWPIPPPYPRWFKTGFAVRGKKGYETMCYQKAMNMVVTSLSWLHLGKPVVAPPELHLTAELSKGQWSVVKRLESYLVDLFEYGEVGPQEMGRTAMKVESLDSALEDLHVFAARLLPADYRSTKVGGGGAGDFLMQKGLPRDAGRVVGKFSHTSIQLAKDVEPDRLSVPREPPQFKPDSLFDEPHRTVYRDPLSRSIDDPDQLPLPPRVSIRSSREGALQLLRFLDDRHRLSFIPESKVRPGRTCGVFAIMKDQSKDRMIVDARPPNQAEETLSTWTRTLGTIEALEQIELAPSCNLELSGTDLCDYYYCYRVSAARASRNVLNMPLSHKAASQFSSYLRQSHQLPADQRVFPCISTLAMGDCQAVELGQCAHIKLGIIAGAFSPEELLYIHGRGPRGAIAAGVVIDDVLIAEQVPSSPLQNFTEGERRLALLCEEYLQRGLVPHPRKTFKRELATEVWGAAINGCSGVVRPSPKRVIPLMMLTSRLALLGFSTVALLQVISGSWISVLQTRRRMLCLLDHLYLAQQGRDLDDVVQLSPAAIAECWTLVSLAPMVVFNLRARSHDEVFMSDASEWGTAAVKAKTTQTFVQELHRHSLSRGTWSRLLSPWQCWLKSHDMLHEDSELPEGVPLVSHPVWLALAQSFKYKLAFKKPCKSRRHINLLELESVLEVERLLGRRLHSLRYVLASDSQVTLACLLKGRSSSPSLNTLLQRSLSTILGEDLYGSYGYVPSLANPGDDPTRCVDIREPCCPEPSWLKDAQVGLFEKLDQWLESLGFSPAQVAKSPFAEQKGVDKEVCRAELLKPLREVQKPERLAAFDKKRSDALVSPLGPSLGFSENGKDEKEISKQKENEEENKREQKEPLAKPKFDDKRPKENKKEEGPIQAVVSSLRQVAPPDSLRNSLSKPQDTVFASSDEAAGLSSSFSGVRRKKQRKFAENPNSPELSAECLALLATFPGAQFFAPGGRRHHGDFCFKRRGYLDLYSGKAGVARAIAKKYRVWALTFDYDHHSRENLLDKEVQSKVFTLLQKHAVLGVGLAPECASFSRAVTPAVRSRLEPEGLKNVTDRMATKVAVGNLRAAFTLEVILLCIQEKLAYWCENPDGSFLWLMPAWVKAGVATFQSSYRVDFCVFKTPWRKRTRVCVSSTSELAGMRQLCDGTHFHQVLRGRSSLFAASWTRVAQVYPRGFCLKLAAAFAREVGLEPKQKRVNSSEMARCGHQRIGEASHPGPRRPAARQARDLSQLHSVAMVNPSTQLLQHRVWIKFEAWLEESFSPDTIQELFLCPLLAVRVLQKYGHKLFEEGAALYELRHVLVLAQQRHPELRPLMSVAWDVVSRWEEISPVQHRIPLAEILFRAMFALAVHFRWYRWAGALMLGYEGISRIGEVLKATRQDLVLPADMFDPSYRALFLRVRQPKGKRRGKGRSQHSKVEAPDAVEFISRVFYPLAGCLLLFPLSSSVFRRRWEKLLDVLQVPPVLRPTPASIRGGGAILAYRRGESVQSILWRMRLKSQVTLESYLQELAAEGSLNQMPERTKERIKFASSFYFAALKSPGETIST